jgi:hypothetical protein
MPTLNNVHLRPIIRVREVETRTDTGARVAVADGVLTESEAAELADSYQREGQDALWALLDIHRAVARGELKAEPAAHATVRNLLIRERLSPNQDVIARRTMKVLRDVAKDGVVDKADAQRIIEAARRDVSKPAADKLIGEAFRAWAMPAHDEAPLATITDDARVLLDQYFKACDLPYGENTSRIEAIVGRAVKHIRGRDVGVKPDTRFLHQLETARNFFVDATQRRFWVNSADDRWSGPISFDRGPEGRTMEIGMKLHIANSEWKGVELVRDDVDYLRWAVSGPDTSIYRYTALLETEDAKNVIIERTRKSDGRVDYSELHS